MYRASQDFGSINKHVHVQDVLEKKMIMIIIVTRSENLLRN